MQTPQTVTVLDGDPRESERKRTFLLIQPPNYQLDAIFNVSAKQLEQIPPLSAEYASVANQVEQLCQNADYYDHAEVFEKVELPKPPVDVKQGWGAPTTSKFERNYLISINDFTDNGDQIKNKLKTAKTDSKKPTTTFRADSNTVFTRNASKRVKNTQVDEFDDLNW